MNHSAFHWNSRSLLSVVSQLKLPGWWWKSCDSKRFKKTQTDELERGLQHTVSCQFVMLNQLCSMMDQNLCPHSVVSLHKLMFVSGLDTDNNKHRSLSLSLSLSLCSFLSHLPLSLSVPFCYIIYAAHFPTDPLLSWQVTQLSQGACVSVFLINQHLWKHCPHLIRACSASVMKPV